MYDSSTTIESLDSNRLCMDSKLQCLTEQCETEKSKHLLGLRRVIKKPRLRIVNVKRCSLLLWLLANVRM